MNCRAFDALLCDYLDTTLPLEERNRVEHHAADCPACSEKLADARFALGFLRDTPGVEPPAELVSDILQQTVGAASPAPVLAAAGSGKRAGLLGLLQPLFHPLVEPRFAMSMAMAALSFSMLAFSWQTALTAWESHGAGPIAAVHEAGDQFEQAWERGVEVYETLSVSFQSQIESQLGSGAADPNGNEPPSPSETSPRRQQR